MAEKRGVYLTEEEHRWLLMKLQSLPRSQFETVRELQASVVEKLEDIKEPEWPS